MSFLRLGKNSFRLMWYLEDGKKRKTFVYGCVNCNELMIEKDCVKHKCEVLK